MRILNQQMLAGHGNIQGRKNMLDILEAGLQAANPHYNTLDLFRREGDFLYIGGSEFEAENDPRSGTEVIDLRETDRIIVVGAAKGIQHIVTAIEEKLGDVLTGGHVIGKYGDDLSALKKIGSTLAAHPTPDKNCVLGCEKILEWTKEITERDVVITVMGNGCSSLLTYPAEGISVEEVAELTHIMQIEKGVPTYELNIIRNHIDRLKGGRITKLFHPARLICLDCIDVNDPYTQGVRGDWYSLLKKNYWLHNLSEGSTFQEAVEIIEKYDMSNRCASSILSHLKEARPEDETVHFDKFIKLNFRVFGITPFSRNFMEAAKCKARELGYNALTLAFCEGVESQQAARVFSSIAKQSASYGEPFKSPVALFVGEEMVVATGNSSGVGGRNQEYALMFATLIAGYDNITVGAVDTDGTDGPGGLDLEGAPKCLGGGIVDGFTMERALKAGIDVKSALQTHATSEALWRIDCGIHITQNVSLGDLTAILIDK